MDSLYAHFIAIIWPFQRSVGVDPVAHFQSLTFLNSSTMKKNKESGRSGSSAATNYVGKYIKAFWCSDVS